MIEFNPFPKIARLNREIIVTEKIDGTNAQVFIRPADGEPLEFGYDTQIVLADGTSAYIRAGSRTRWLTHAGKGDNFGFGAWVHDNAHELAKLGLGSHFGEWWGQGIQRGYGQVKRFFSLFNVSRWSDHMVRPMCCAVVPVLYEGEFDQFQIDVTLWALADNGSAVVPGFMDPEGIVVYHTAANQLFKVTLKNDEVPKALREAA